jgi:hypothetical protein
MLFPAWVGHGVRENETDEERISISFNFIPVRTKKDMMDIIKDNEISVDVTPYNRQTNESESV